MSPPNSRIVTCESVGLLNRFESEHVPKNTLLWAANALFKPVAAGAGALPPVLAGAVDVGAVVETVVGADAPGRHCE